PRKAPKGTVVLRGATVITMKGDEVLKNADIVVENNRIKSVGARGSVPAGAKVFDVSGKTITPGFVDTHAHWFEIRRGILDTQNIKSYVVGNRKQRQFMVQASKELGMMPTTEGALDLKLNLTHAIDGFHGNEHTLPITPLYKDVIQMFAQSGIAETPTLIVN